MSYFLLFPSSGEVRGGQETELISGFAPEPAHPNALDFRKIGSHEDFRPSGPSGKSPRVSGGDRFERVSPVINFNYLRILGGSRKNIEKNKMPKVETNKKV